MGVQGHSVDQSRDVREVVAAPVRRPKFKTPCLVVHGEQDFRVPFTEGLQFFTALQRLGVPSKLLYFPDEGHFVPKPQNAELWWKTLQEWFAEYLK